MNYENQSSILDKIKNPNIHQFLISIDDKIKFTSSQIREIVQIFLELEEKFDDILKDEELNHIISHPKLTKKKKGTKYYQRLKAIRYPELTRYQLEFKKEIKKITQKMRNLKIETSPYFENNNIKLCINATSNVELEETLKYLLKITQNGNFSNIFNLIYGKI
ncbi:MAG: hypothetical protein AB1567_04715 [bacterium]